MISFSIWSNQITDAIHSANHVPKSNVLRSCYFSSAIISSCSCCRNDRSTCQMLKQADYASAKRSRNQALMLNSRFFIRYKMEKEITNKVTPDIADNADQDSHQESRFRSHTSITSKENPREPKPDLTKVKKAIHKLKTTTVTSARRKASRIPVEQEQNEMEDITPPEEFVEPEEEIVVDQPAVKSLEPDHSLEEAGKGISIESTVTYLYKPFTPLPNLAQHIQQVIAVYIASEYICKNNRAYKKRNFWGTDIYTSDSDLVCILQHSGLLMIDESPPQIYPAIIMYFRVAKGRSSYQSSLKNGIRSRKFAAFEGCSIRPENYKPLDQLKTMEDLITMAKLMPETYPTTFKKSIPINIKNVIVPPETEVIYNLSSEPAYKFSLPAFADYGLDPTQRTSNILFENSFYFETFDKRYEIAKEGPKTTSYILSEVLSPFEKDSEFMGTHNVPLESKYVKKILNGVNWEEFKWSADCSLYVKGFVINSIVNFKYFPLKKIQ